MTQKQRFNEYLKSKGWIGNISDQALETFQKIAEIETANLWCGDITLTESSHKGIMEEISKSNHTYSGRLTLEDINNLKNGLMKQAPPKKLIP